MMMNFVSPIAGASVAFACILASCSKNEHDEQVRNKVLSLNKSEVQQLSVDAYACSLAANFAHEQSDFKTEGYRRDANVYFTFAMTLPGAKLCDDMDKPFLLGCEFYQKLKWDSNENRLAGVTPKDRKQGLKKGVEECVRKFGRHDEKDLKLCASQTTSFFEKHVAPSAEMKYTDTTKRYSYRNMSEFEQNKLYISENCAHVPNLGVI